jgi:hypothetical protein
MLNLEPVIEAPNPIVKPTFHASLLNFLAGIPLLTETSHFLLRNTGVSLPHHTTLRRTDVRISFLDAEIDVCDVCGDLTLRIRT